MKPLVIIPARGGSKGLPKKNIKLLNDKPLIYYTIEAARKVFEEDSIIVSTDSNEIKEVCEQIGLKVPFIRPSHLATDFSTTRDVVLHALDYYSKSTGITPDCVILLQPTSPLRTSVHIKEALQLFNNEADMVVSVKKTDANPYYVLFEENSQGYLVKSKEMDISRRQDCPEVFEYNGAIYIYKTESFLDESKYKARVIKYLMDKKDSLDIDDEIDWLVVSTIMNQE
jgi:N-acylneuraminate cytidylyltransferase